MTSEGREIERKYDAKPGAGLPHLEGLPQVASESSVAEEVLDARPELSARSPAADVVLAYFRAHLDALKSMDPQVRRDEPDSVHQMRVTVRRLRATLRNFRDILPGRDMTWLASELRWLGGVLAASRDDEVLTERLRDRQQDTPPELVIGPVNARIRRQFAPLEAGARAAVLEALDSERYLALIDGLDKLAADPPAAAAASQPAGDVLPRIVARAHRRARRQMRRALQAPPGHGRDAALHSARKAVRRARYAAEAAGPGVGKKASRFAKKMKKVQSVLGEHHDTVVARDTLRDLGVRAHLVGENAFTYGLFHAREAGEALTLENLAKQVWARASRPKQVTWMR